MTSESQQAADTCPNCGAGVPATARFCPACGVAVDAGSTVREEIPSNETGPVPVSLERTEPHWFGVAPPNLLLAIAAVAFVFAIVLFASGHWPYGLILFGAAALLLAAFLEAARRRPDSALTRRSTDARERARSSWETLRARQAAQADARRIRSALLLVDSERRNSLHDLGVAVYVGDAEAETIVRERLTELEELEKALRAELAEALSHAEERIRQARLPVDDTMLVPPK